MNVQHAPAQTSEGRDTQRENDTRLHGRWLIMARVVWLALVIPSVGLFVAGLPAYYNQLQTACVGPVTCNIVGALTAKGLQALLAYRLSLSVYAAFFTICWTTNAAIWSGIGFFIFWRRSDEWFAMLSAFFLVMFTITFLGLPSSALALAYPVLNVPITLMSVLGQISIVLFFLLFPNGRFAPRWMGLIIPLIIIQAVSLVIPPTSPFSQNSWPGWLSGLLAVTIDGAVILSQIYRYRRVSTPVERQQTKWVVFSTITVVTGFIVLGFLYSGLFPALNQPNTPSSVILSMAYPLLLLTLPLSIGIAILRYRLWDIDRIINRTLVYGILTVILLVVYLGLIFALQYLLRGIINQNNDVAIVVSTLTIAALFQPLRHRIQRIIDRRFYRSKYDAAKIIATLSTTLRNEVDLNTLSENLVAVVQETMQPSHVSLWLRRPDREVKNE